MNGAMNGGMNDGELAGTHESHAIHQLRFHIKAPGAYICSGCKMPGLDPCLKCINEYCDFHLHKTCFLAERVPLLRHPFFKKCEFEYHESPPAPDHRGEFPYCDACGLDIPGFRYRCNHPDNHHDLHPTCAHLKDEDKRQNENGLIFELQDKVKSKCLHCGERYPAQKCIRFTGLKWVCKKRDWSFPFCFTGRKVCYHLKCMNEIQSSTGGMGPLNQPHLGYFNIDL